MYNALIFFTGGKTWKFPSIPWAKQIIDKSFAYLRKLEWISFWVTGERSSKAPYFLFWAIFFNPDNFLTILNSEPARKWVKPSSSPETRFLAINLCPHPEKQFRFFFVIITFPHFLTSSKSCENIKYSSTFFLNSWYSSYLNYVRFTYL